MSRPVTPALAHSALDLDTPDLQHEGYTGSRPVSRVGPTGTGVETVDHYTGAPHETSMLSQSDGLHDHHMLNDNSSVVQPGTSQMSQSQTMVSSPRGTLKKKSSLRHGGSVKRSGSKKETYAGSVKSLKLGEKEKYEPKPEHNSAFYCPVPITGSPTDLLADRFQAWRKVLKDLIAYFRDIQKSYETRSKSLSSASNLINNSSMPSNFLSTGGLADATHILRDFHKLSINEATKSKEIENEVILQLTGLRSDLQQKIKEIKSLSGDFKNSVGKEQEGTRKALRALQEALGHVDQDAAATSGKGDPYLVKLGVDRQLEKQIEEENYLHRAYLNLEASGRELESIVVGEIQKAYNVLAGIMKREADHGYEAAEKLREGPLAMAKDHEWNMFVTGNNTMVDPRVPLRQYGQITYEGKEHPAAIEVKSGMLERKSKYLKNYTPGWYVLSPTHLHEFKSADHINFQAPIVSLYLPEQKLGTHSEPGSSSHKFMLKGRQTGSMHRGHSWIFRAETYDTMLAWYNDIKELTERRGEARNEFVRRTHARTLSSSSKKAPSIASAESGIEEDEADRVPFSGEQSVRGQSMAEVVAPAAIDGTIDTDIVEDEQSEEGWRPPQRPNPGGRFPSDLNVQRGLQMPMSPSSGDSFEEQDRDVIASAGALPGSALAYVNEPATQPHTDLQRTQYQPEQPQQQYQQYQQRQPEQQYQAQQPQQQYQQHQQTSTYQSGNELAGTAGSAAYIGTQPGNSNYTAVDNSRAVPTASGDSAVETRSTYGDWMAPIATATVLGAAGTHLYDQHQHEQEQQQQQQQQQQRDQQQASHQHNPQAENVVDEMDSPNAAIPLAGGSSAPIPVETAAPIDAPTAPRAMRESATDEPIVARSPTTESARGEVGPTETSRMEPIRSQSARTESTMSDSTSSESTRTGPIRNGPGRMESTRSEAFRPGSTRTQSSISEAIEVGPATIVPIVARSARIEPNRSESVRSETARIGNMTDESVQTEPITTQSSAFGPEMTEVAEAVPIMAKPTIADSIRDEQPTTNPTMARPARTESPMLGPARFEPNVDRPILNERDITESTPREPITSDSDPVESTMTEPTAIDSTMPEPVNETYAPPKSLAPTMMSYSAYAIPDDTPTAPRAMNEPTTNESSMTESNAPQSTMNEPTTAETTNESLPAPQSSPRTMFSFGAHAPVSVPMVNSRVGTAEPSASQILIAAGIDPNPAHTSNAYSLGPMPGVSRSLPRADNIQNTTVDTKSEPLDTTTSSTTLEANDATADTDTDHAGHSRPHPKSSQSVSTISDLHIPGEFPQTPAVEKGGFTTRY